MLSANTAPPELAQTLTTTLAYFEGINIHSNPKTKLLALSAASRSPNEIRAHRVIPNNTQQRPSESGYPPSVPGFVEPRSNVNIGDGPDAASEKKSNES